MRLFFAVKASEPSTSTSNTEDFEEQKLKKSRADGLKEFLSPKTKFETSLSTSNDELDQLETEFASFESTDERPLLSEKFFMTLKAIPPTSSETEKVFSTSGLFNEGIRSYD